MDAISGHELLIFIDAFSSYNQIWMAPEDEKKITFITDWDLFYYKAIPFSSKNAGTTYQQLVNKIFKKQIGRNIEVYMDDLLVKSLTSGDHIVDLRETFNTLRKYQMKLNSVKYIFKVTFRKFLGFMVLCKGIEANPKKIKTIQEMILRGPQKMSST